MQDEWSVLGTISAGLVGLLIALARGWLVTPMHVAMWESRWNEMKDDRNYWREKAHSTQHRTEEAISLQSQNLERNDA